MSIDSLSAMELPGLNLCHIVLGKTATPLGKDVRPPMSQNDSMNDMDDLEKRALTGHLLPGELAECHRKYEAPFEGYIEYVENDAGDDWDQERMHPGVSWCEDLELFLDLGHCSFAEWREHPRTPAPSDRDIVVRRRKGALARLLKRGGNQGNVTLLRLLSDMDSEIQHTAVNCFLADVNRYTIDDRDLAVSLWDDLGRVSRDRYLSHPNANTRLCFIILHEKIARVAPPEIRQQVLKTLQRSRTRRFFLEWNRAVRKAIRHSVAQLSSRTMHTE